MKGASNGAKIKISNARYSGKIVTWKGKFGWIQPSIQVNHPLASAKRGQIFLDIQDVDQDISGEGADVEFFIYADRSGLGAMNCVPAGSAIAPTVVPAKTSREVTLQTPKWGAPAQKPPWQPKQASGAPTPRERISKYMFSGKIGYWKNNISWIDPLEPINHPLFKKKIYVDFKDVASASQIPEQCNVIFYIYSDGKGLGAEEVRTRGELDETTNTKPPPGKPKAKAKTNAKLEANAKAQPVPPREPPKRVAEAEAKAKAKPVPPREPPKKVAEAEHVPEPEAKAKAKPVPPREPPRRGAEAEHVPDPEAKAKAKPVPPREPPPKRVAEAEDVPEPEAKKGKLHDLPRDRLTTIPTTGDVVRWKKAFGWIQPHEPIDELVKIFGFAQPQKGQIFVSQKDLVGMRELQPGQIVQFHVFADESGLGAEECSAC